MEGTKISAIRGLVVLGALLWLLPSGGEAATTQVDCSTASLQAAVEKAKPGDTLLVSGTCKENVVIYEEVARITLDGQGKAAIEGADGRRPTIVVRGRGITVKGFRVTGGGFGILVVRGGEAIIDGNTIEGNTSDGIALAESSARIENNTVRNNRGQGIVLGNGASAWIGVRGIADRAPSPNIIENNGTHGILMALSSSARIVGNTIRNNKRNGIVVARGASALVSGNTIDANGDHGINVASNAHVTTEGAGGTEIFRLPNKTTSNNSGFGIRCVNNSSVDGRLGSLNGNKGAKDIDPSCVDGLKT